MTTQDKAEDWGFADRARPVVNSFDVFDTLFARRCHGHTRIHESVERQSGVAGFAQARVSAEIAASAGAYTLDDIYAELGRAQGWDAAQLDRLKKMEIDTELANVIPIADAMNQVRDGDVLISDQYLGEKNIRALLEKAGFRKNTGLYVSAHGKASGEVWPKILRQFRIGLHLGDNKASDVESPQRYGIVARLATDTHPTPTEAWLMKTGLHDVARLCREARLTTPAPDPIGRELINLQTSLNFPMLLLASVPLARLIQREGITRVLFSSRDGELWSKLFRKFAARIGLNVDIEYFYTSRLARRAPSDTYLAYAKDRLAGNTLLLDLCGTGWSVAHLYQKLGGARGKAFMLVRGAPMAAYEKAGPTPDTVDFHSIVTPSDDPISNSNLELINAVPYGSAVDVRLIDKAFMPVFDPDRRSAATLAYIRAQVAAFDRAVDAMDFHEIANLMTLEDKVAGGIAGFLARHVASQVLLPSVYIAAAVEEDADVCRRLGCPEIYGA